MCLSLLEKDRTQSLCLFSSVWWQRKVLSFAFLSFFLEVAWQKGGFFFLFFFLDQANSSKSFSFVGREETTEEDICFFSSFAQSPSSPLSICLTGCCADCLVGSLSHWSLTAGSLKQRVSFTGRRGDRKSSARGLETGISAYFLSLTGLLEY